MQVRDTQAEVAMLQRLFWTRTAHDELQLDVHLAGWPFSVSRMVLSLSSYSTRVALLLTTTAATLLLLTLAHFGPPRFRPLASTMAPTPTQQLESLTVGTLNLRYDGSWRETVPVGQPGDGRDATYRPGGDDGYGEKASITSLGVARGRH